MSQKEVNSALAYQYEKTDELVGELRSGAGMVKWLISLSNSIGGAAVGFQIGAEAGALVGLVVGALLGALFGGIAAAVLEWMAQVLLGRRELMDYEQP